MLNTAFYKVQERKKPSVLDTLNVHVHKHKA